MTKAELSAKIAEVTGEAAPDPEKHTVEQLEAMLKDAQENAGDDDESDGASAFEKLKTPGGLTRHKLNRGSTRRISRALEAMQKSIDEFVKEIDRQVYVTDEDGNRVDDCDLVKAMREIRSGLAAEVAKFTTP